MVMTYSRANMCHPEHFGHFTIKCYVDLWLLLLKATESHLRPLNINVNGILGKLLNTASEDVILQLISSKCVPILLYGLEACSLTKTDLRSLDFTVTRVLMKIFKTGAYVCIVQECQVFFGFQLPSVLLPRRTNNFLKKYGSSANTVCKLLSSV